MKLPRLMSDPLLPGVRVRLDGRLVVRDADVEHGFASAMGRLGPFVRARAKRLCGGDRDYAEDLVQEAWIKLWELDPLRFDPNDQKDQAYVRQALALRMRDVALADDPLPAGPEIVRLHVRLE